ncbi:MAG TPA: hypothetical protein VNN80_19360 [Polyangiaceae bacterium]|nr:hypothetical protein [Polyangiaceae bacterium]
MERIRDSVPSIVPVVSDGAGAPLTEVRVSMDGELLIPRIEGRSVDVDPGMHELTFATEAGEVHREQVLILEGQRNRVISVVLSPQATAATPAAGTRPAATEPDVPAPAQAVQAPAHPDETEPTSSVLPYVIGGVGVAAIGTSFLLAHWGSDNNRELDSCSPNCSQESVDHVRRMYIAADITLGAGVVALGAATWLYFSGADREGSDDAAAYRIDVRPTARGAMATMVGEF